jgi:hypothetical protein
MERIVLNKFLAPVALVAAFLFLFICSLFSTQPARAQEQPCQWNYSNVLGVATATYCGNVTAKGLIAPGNTVQNFGAKCDGVTNDTAAFILANAAPAALGPAQIQAGVCLVTGPLTLSHAFTSIAGGVVKPAAGTTIAFTGPYAAGAYKVCDITAGGHCDFTKILEGQGFVEWFGAVGGDTDFVTGKTVINTASVNEALKYAPSKLYAMNKAYSITGVTWGDTGPLTLVGNPLYPTFIGSGTPAAYASDVPNLVNMTASLSGTTLTVSAIANGTIRPGQIVTGAGVAPYTVIVAQLTGTTGSTGTYSVEISQTVSSQTMIVETPCRNRNIVLQNGVQTTGAPLKLENVSITTSNSDAVAMAICTTDSTLGHPFLAWQYNTYGGVFGAALPSNPKGAYTGLDIEWANWNQFQNTTFEGDTAALTMVLPNVPGGYAAIQKVSFVGSNYACNVSNTHGMFIYQDNQSAALIDANTWTGNTTFEFCHDIAKLNGGGQNFNATWMERVDAGGGNFWEDVASDSHWFQPNASFVISNLLFLKLAPNSSVNTGNTVLSSPSKLAGVYTGVGSPNGSVYAGPGSIYLRTDGTNILTTPCFKISGPSNTSWINATNTSC